MKKTLTMIPKADTPQKHLRRHGKRLVHRAERRHGKREVRDNPNPLTPALSPGGGEGEDNDVPCP